MPTLDEITITISRETARKIVQMIPSAYVMDEPALDAANEFVRAVKEAGIKESEVIDNADA